MPGSIEHAMERRNIHLPLPLAMLAASVGASQAMCTCWLSFSRFSRLWKASGSSRSLRRTSPAAHLPCCHERALLMIALMIGTIRAQDCCRNEEHWNSVL